MEDVRSAPQSASTSTHHEAEPQFEEDNLGVPKEIPNLDALITIEAEIYRWSFESEQFDNDGIVFARICRQNDDRFAYWIVAATKEGSLLAHRISPDTNPRLSHKMLTFTWNNFAGDNGQNSSWLFRFTTEDDYANFITTFVRAQWETLHQAPFEKMKVRRLICLYYLGHSLTNHGF